MKQPEQPLYPKLSSIYNKILQLASAILIIIVLMSMWQSTINKDESTLEQHFDYLAKQYLQQSASGISVLLSHKYSSKKERNKALQNYLNGLIEVDFVKQAHLYDKKGLLLHTGKSLIESTGTNEQVAFEDPSKTMLELYGVSAKSLDKSSRYSPYVMEIRQEKLLGYLRFTFESTYLTQGLSEADNDRQTLLRLMLLLAGVVGFLLTRGLNRFSRRSYRINQTIKAAEQGTPKS
ncbi:hypothetical protein [Litorilituus lipolyticus]|uniref:Smp protein n=1 Tax=Litorilituus lipolyticus TaxID=2491017 RepID=A0A502L6L9_9GAMM|nr:hypothetical protein [Litorilituus lipolyticus]TPH19376.1 hypothetical protein EPA86_00935 [Litorilituus lipolyticus]